MILSLILKSLGFNLKRFNFLNSASVKCFLRKVFAFYFIFFYMYIENTQYVLGLRTPMVAFVLILKRRKQFLF